MFQIIMKFS